ncbi:MAG: acyl-CoA reductase [Bacteroidota bacterium]
MITLEERLNLLARLSQYIQQDEEWNDIKIKANQENGWFVEQFTNLAISNILKQYLDAEKLIDWIKKYDLPQTRKNPSSVGIVMAGNIPLVGFHDFLCGFVSGHNMIIKRSSKDSVLITHIVTKMTEWDKRVGESVVFSEILKGCDAYIATGSNNSGRYFEYYFKNYPSIIRKNRTSVAILTGEESQEDLANLAGDLLLYFGLGCRNVSKLYAPESYDFIPLLAAMKPFQWMDDHQKFKNNYDYNLSLLLLNNQYYMTNGIVLLVENPAIFSPISQINLEYYKGHPPINFTHHEHELQAIVGRDYTPFGQAQSPSISNYADGVDTLQFLSSL